MFRLFNTPVVTLHYTPKNYPFHPLSKLSELQGEGTNSYS